MNILQINNYAYRKGGAESHFLDLITLLKSKGHQVSIFSANSEKKYFLNFSAARRLQKLLDKQNVDLAHIHNINYHLSPLILKILQKNKIPVVMTVHDYSLISANYNLYLNYKINFKNFILSLEFYLRNIFFKTKKLIDVFIAPSNFMKNKLESYGFNNITVINNFTNIDLINNNYQLGRYFLYFGRLSEEKGLEKFIKTISKLKKSFLFYIVGRGPEEKKLKRLVKKLSLSEKIKFLGYYLPKKKLELNKVIAKAQFVVLPSLCPENCSLSILEAMAQGKLVLASDLGGNSELISNQNGVLYNPNNEEDLLDKINILIDNEKSNQKIGQRARNYVQTNFNKEKYYQKLIKVYENSIYRSKRHTYDSRRG